MKENIFIDEYYYNASLHSKHRNIHLQILSHGYARLKRGWKSPSFSTTFSHLYYILDGENTFYNSEGKCFTFSAGHCYLIPAGCAINQECHSHVTQLYFHIKLCGLDDIDLLKNCSQPLTLPLLPEQAASCLELIHSQDIADHLKLKLEIYHTILRFLTEYHISLTIPEYPLSVQNVIKYINDHLSMQLSIQELCTNLNLAPSTISKEFKHFTDMTIGNYIDHAVMARAQQILMCSEKSILEVSESLGFCDQGYFTRKFKSTFGISPSIYKKLQQNAKK